MKDGQKNKNQLVAESEESGFRVNKLVISTGVQTLAGELPGEYSENLINVLNSMEDGVYIVNQDYDIEFVNTSLQKEFGPPEGMKCYRYFHDNSESCSWCKNQEVFAGKSVRWVWYSDKTKKTYDLTDTPIYKPDGSISKLEIFRDITEQKKAQEALQESEEKFRSIFSESPIGIHLFDQNGKSLYMNKSCREIFGIENESDLKDFRVFDDPNFPDEFKQKILKESESIRYVGEIDFDIIREFDVIKTSKSGKITIDTQFTPLFSGNSDSPVGFLAHIQDITERIKADENLKWEANLNAALVELSQVLITPSRSIETISLMILDYARLLTGSEHGYVSPVDPDTGNLVSSTITYMMGKQCIVTGDDKRIEFPIGPDGKYPSLWGHVLNTRQSFYTNEPSDHPTSAGIPEGHIPVRNFLSTPAMYDDKLVGQIALANNEKGYSDRDLEAIEKLARMYALAFESNRADTELQQKNVELKRALKVKTEFLSMVSHELRTPLVPIIGYSELLADGLLGDIPAEAVDSVNIIKDRAQYLAKLIEDLLVLTRMEGGKIILDLKPINVAKRVREIIADYRLVQHAKPVSVDWSGEEFTVLADQTRVHQILRNLIENAIKFSNETVHITFQTRCEFSKGIITVYDNGIGIPAEHLPRVFDRFYQVEDVDIRKHGGTGLGLAITKELTELMGGTISVSSEVGKGSTFTIILPLA